VWNRIDGLFKKGDVLLDLGCGTGVDAMHLQARGASVYGIDSSPRMVGIARDRAIEADCCPIEDIQYFDLEVDGVISNFGALNCVESLDSIARSLGRIVRSGGHVALCFLSDICLWEMVYYLLRANPGKASRRLRKSADSSIGRVFYYSSAEIAAAFRSEFRLLDSCGIGLFVPPSYVKVFTDWEMDLLSVFDRVLANKPVLRGMADHRLYIFEHK
jgi:SAM-dependent methyltransferase